MQAGERNTTTGRCLRWVLDVEMGPEAVASLFSHPRPLPQHLLRDTLPEGRNGQTKSRVHVVGRPHPHCSSDGERSRGLVNSMVGIWSWNQIFLGSNPSLSTH